MSLSSSCMLTPSFLFPILETVSSLDLCDTFSPWFTLMSLNIISHRLKAQLWYFLKKKYVFIFGCTGLCCCAGAFSSCSGGEQRRLSSCAVQVLYYGGFSCCRAPALGHAGFTVAAHGLSSSGFQAPDVGLVVVVHRLRCPVACDEPWMNQCPLHCKADS